MSDDRYLKKELWADGDEAYYPKGVDDPDYIVLRFRTRSARLYDGSRSSDIKIG